MQRSEYIADYIVFDLETTGTSCVYDEVVEISAIKVENHKPVSEFSTLVKPGRSIPYYASQVNGITDEMVKDAPVFEQALAEFLEYAGDFPFVGHNIHVFDMKFIYRDSERYFGKVPVNDYIDTLKIARDCLPDLAHHKLTDLAGYYGISIEGAHRALNDCRMNQAVYECLGKEMINLPGIRKCPRCGAFMKKRNGKFGMFWGCGSYPDCRYTENL